jgi:hypothetical protein
MQFDESGFPWTTSLRQCRPQNASFPVPLAYRFDIIWAEYAQILASLIILAEGPKADQVVHGPDPHPAPEQAKFWMRKDVWLDDHGFLG